MAESTWKMPSMDTEYVCWDGVKRTLGRLLDGVELDMWPQDDTDMGYLLWAWGAELA